MHRLSPFTHSAERSRYKYAWRPGFTIVELLIVVVVIAILAAITIVSYNGISASAKESALKSDLNTAAKKLHVAKVEDGSFPGPKPDYISDNLTYAGGGTAFCISGTANGKDFRIKESGSVEEGDCAAPVATTMQAFSSAQCSALPTFAGSNSEAVIQLTDSRGGTIQTYEVAKLADGNCWMLTNLKLGSISGPITLTPGDSNVAANFTLPQLITATSLDLDLPRAYGPILGDTGSGATNYGYLYNFAAATAGETRTTLTTGNAEHSICPANWRLPTGTITGEFAWLNAKMNNPSASVPSTDFGTGYYQNWQYTGAFKGIFSGYLSGDSFNGQGSNGNLWSSSGRVHSGSTTAHIADFSANNVRPGSNNGIRSYGIAIRCLLN